MQKGGVVPCLVNELVQRPLGPAFAAILGVILAFADDVHITGPPRIAESAIALSVS